MSLTPGSLLWRGMLTTAVGIATLAWPGSVIDAVVVLFSVYAFVAGALVCLTAFASDRVGPVVGGLMLGFLSFAVGTTALLWPSVAAYTLTIWFGARALVAGAVEIGITFSAGENAGKRAVWLLSGAVSVLLAFALIVHPHVGAVSRATVVGLFGLLYGMTGIIISIAWKSRRPAIA